MAPPYRAASHKFPRRSHRGLKARICVFENCAKTVCFCKLSRLFYLTQSSSFHGLSSICLSFEGDITPGTRGVIGAFSATVWLRVLRVFSERSQGTECTHVAHMLTIIRQFPQGDQRAGRKVYVNLRLQSAGTVVIPTTVNMLAKTNQWIFHLLAQQAIHLSTWHGTVHCNAEV